MYWHSSLREVPRVFSLFVLHEFLDALPVHKFQKTASGWREVLIDIQANSQVRYGTCVAICISAYLVLTHLPEFMPAFLPVCLPTCLPTSTCLPTCVHACLPACLSTCLPTHLPACLLTSLPACLSSFCLRSTFQPVFQGVFLSVFLPAF